MSKIIIADDHPLYRTALIRTLQSDFSFLCEGESLTPVESCDFDSTIKALIDNPDADLLLLDLHMPGTYGLLGLIQLRKNFTAIPIVVISARDDLEVVRRVIAFGAAAFIPKSASPADIVEALCTVRNGDIWVPASMRLSVMESDHDGTDEDLAFKVSQLTGQQYKVLYFLTEGWLNKQIAHEMDITEATVKAHVTSIFRKLDCSNRTQVVIVAQQLRLTPPLNEGVSAS